jgi:hypothetical protein
MVISVVSSPQACTADCLLAFVATTHTRNKVSRMMIVLVISFISDIRYCHFARFR